VPSPPDHLATSLALLKDLQRRGQVAVRARDLSRVHRERLTRNGFLREVMKGWYIPARPQEPDGDSTGWYAAYWRFASQYLESRFGEQWCLSADQSLLLHVGDRTVPQQLLARTPKGSNKPTPLPHDTSVFDVRLKLPAAEERTTIEGVRVMTLAAALANCSPDMFRARPVELRAALAMLPDSADLLRCLLQGGKSKIAGRLAGALRNIGRATLADQVRDTMRTAGYTVAEIDPFAEPSPVQFAGRPLSPYVGRMRLMWATMRTTVLENFPAPPAVRLEKAAYLQQMEDVYCADAYHSLSIEGYQVSEALIERVRSGAWTPDHDEADRQNRNALAARGYWQAFQRVKAAVEQVLDGGNAGEIADRVHPEWYRELFGPSVAAGILRPADLAGYRNGPVYIRRSLHVPPPMDAVRDLMPEFFALLAAEPEPAVRVVLGHFFFVYVHPYFDGNGRMARFLMNLMVASGGWHWTLVTLDTRDAYMAALEQASVYQDIAPFTRYLATRRAASAQLGTAS
jgi:fido (protein-threonine AMPylation protein)